MRSATNEIHVNRLRLHLLFVVCGFGWLVSYCVACQTVSASDVGLNVSRNVKEIEVDLMAMFPPSTPKAHVEQVLLQSGAVIEPDEQRPNVFYYKFPAVGPLRSARTVTVMYYIDNTVRQIRLTGVGAIFPETPPPDRSDATVFRFEDYSNVDDLVETFRALFPVDTPRDDVEKVLVYWAGAEAWTRLDEPNQVVYRYRFDDYGLRGAPAEFDQRVVWNVLARYTTDGKLSQLLVDGSPVKRTYRLTREYFLCKRGKGSCEKPQSVEEKTRPANGGSE